MRKEFDPIELEILWSNLISIADEATETLIRVAFSSVLREASDFSFMLLDSRGNSLVQSAKSIPSFIGTLSTVLEHMLNKFPASTLKPGDILITNNPWIASGHLPDIATVMPIFRGDRLVAFSGCIAHSPDIGGRIRSCDSREIYEEGLQIPMAKIFKAGKMNDELKEIIMQNVRVPDEWMGDLQAEVTAHKTAERKLLTLMDDHNLDNLNLLADTIQNYSELALRNEIKKLPNTVCSHEIWLDGYEKPLNIKIQITISDSSMKVDYKGTCSQVDRGLNSVMNYTRAYTIFPIKTLLIPEIPNNEGCFNPIEVTAPIGSLLNPRYPAAVGGRCLAGHILVAAVFGALSKVIPEKIPADPGSPIWILTLSGINKKGRKFTNIGFYNGGIGASIHGDGMNCMSFPSNLQNTPIEITEYLTPVVVEKKELRMDSGGAGKFRGGLGQEVTIRFDNEIPLTASFINERIKFPPLGREGGKPGIKGEILLNGKAMSSPKENKMIKKGDKLILKIPGGGGFGNPSQRDNAKIKEDILNGYISAEKAKLEYNYLEI